MDAGTATGSGLTGTTRLTAAQAIRGFYENLAFAAWETNTSLDVLESGWGLPTRVTRWGLAFAGYGTGRFHSVAIQAYAGRRGVAAGPNRMLPRIAVNEWDFDLPRARARLWSDRAGLPRSHNWKRATARLEFTVTLEELGKVGLWLAAWTLAVDLQDVTKLLPCPVEVEHELAPEEWLRMSYVWSRAANAEYTRRRPTPKPGELVVGGKVVSFRGATR